MKSKEYQQTKIKAHLVEHGNISVPEAEKLYGARNLAMHIHCLRIQGHVIDTIKGADKRAIYIYRTFDPTESKYKPKYCQYKKLVVRTMRAIAQDAFNYDNWLVKILNSNADPEFIINRILNEKDFQGSFEENLAFKHLRLAAGVLGTLSSTKEETTFFNKETNHG